MSEQFDYDLFVIGAGSAGVRASRMIAGLGKRVAIAEKRFYGGTCVNVGCVPKKLFVYASEFNHTSAVAKGFGVNLEQKPFDWTTLRDNKTKEIERLNGIYQKLLEGSGVDILWGEAQVTGPNTVSVKGKAFTAEKILLATGGRPLDLEINGGHLAINSDEFFYMDAFPESAMIVGSGYIAVEFAGILNGLGCKTTIASRSGKLLRGFDESTREFAQDQILAKGINLIKEAPKSLASTTSGMVNVSFDSHQDVGVNVVINATGRTPAIERLWSPDIEIAQSSRHYIEVNEQFETNLEGVYAMGDLIDTPQLTPVALAEAMCFMRQQYQSDRTPLDYSNIPTAVFSQPNLSTVGLSEEQAKKDGYDIDIYESNFKAMKFTLSDETERTYMKMVVCKHSDKVLGCHMVGAYAGEIMQGIAVAIKAGATKKIFDQTIGIHPSSAEEFVTMRTASR